MRPGAIGAEPLTSAAAPAGARGWATPEREQKRLLSRAQAQRLLERIADRAELEVHDPARPVELTWTTYLDTDDLRFFASSRSALARRVRIREYASAASPAAVPLPAGVSFLELKESAAGRRRKVRYRADRAGIDAVLAALARGDPPDPRDATLVEIARALAGVALRPRVCTAYRRLSLAATADVRITLDEDVRFYRPPPPGSEAAIAPAEALVGSAPGVVVEVKARGALPGWVVGALDEIEPLPDFSKFRLGLELVLHPGARDRRDAAIPEAPLQVPRGLRRRTVGGSR